MFKNFKFNKRLCYGSPLKMVYFKKMILKNSAKYLQTDVFYLFLSVVACKNIYRQFRSNYNSHLSIRQQRGAWRARYVTRAASCNSIRAQCARLRDASRPCLPLYMAQVHDESTYYLYLYTCNNTFYFRNCDAKLSLSLKNRL